MFNQGKSFPGACLIHPVIWIAILVLLLNDQWWKWSYSSWWTGKLSDIAGLLFFPLLLQALWEFLLYARGRYQGPSKRVLYGSILATAIGFICIQLFSWAGNFYQISLALLQWPVRFLLSFLQDTPVPALGRVMLSQDPSDLLTLPILGVSLWIGLNRLKQNPGEST